MTTTIPTADVVVSVEPLFSPGERIALAGFLAGYSGLTRDAYALDLRMFTAWCQQHGLRLFQARRADIECFGRQMEAHGRARATIARRLCTIAGFYRYAVEEELLEHSPAVHVRRPRLDYESHAVGLDRNDETSKKPPPTPTPAPPCATTAPASPSTDTPPTSSPPTSPAPPDKPGTPPGDALKPRRPAQADMRGGRRSARPDSARQGGARSNEDGRSVAGRRGGCSAAR